MSIMSHVARRPLLAALFVSLMAHVVLLASTGRYWTLIPPEVDFPIEASLQEAPPAPPPQAHVPPAPAPAVRKPVFVPPQPEPVRPALPERGQEKETSAAIEPAAIQDKPIEPAASPDLPQPETVIPRQEVPAAPTPLLRKTQRSLPGKLEIRYAVLMGEAGFVAGEAVYHWHARQGRYSLVSTLKATGLTALFIHGSIVQVSEGTLDASGLRPEQYWLKRGERKQDTARFLWPQNRLDLGDRRGVHELTPQAQDLLSFPFHLALTTREDEPEFSLGVTNGRRFKEYAFRSLGRVSLDLGGGKLGALHLQGRREGEGTLDVWLDPERAGVPVKVRTLDQQGKTMMLVLESMQD